MKIHKLKTHPDPFEAITRDIKKCEIRFDDGRDFEIGDILVLDEYVPITKTYTGRTLKKRITHIVNLGDWIPGIDSRWKALSIQEEWR